LLTGLKLLAAIALVSVSSVIYIKSKHSVERYVAAHLEAETLIQQKEYVRAKEVYQLAYGQYTPRITVFMVQSQYKQHLTNVEDAIDAEVIKGLGDIQTFLKADNGRFKKHTEEYLLRLLALRPAHEELQALKE